MEQKKFKVFTKSEIKFWAGFRPAFGLLLVGAISLAFHLGRLTTEGKIASLELWAPVLLLICLIFFCIARNHFFFQRSYIKYKIENLEFDRGRFNKGKGPEDLQDMTTYDLPIQSLETLLARLTRTPSNATARLSEDIMKHDFLQKKELSRPGECQYLAGFMEEVSDTNEQSVKDDNMYRKIDFPDGGPKEACFVLCNCGCGEYRLYSRDGMNIGVGIRTRQSGGKQLVTFSERNWINAKEDSRLHEQLNELKFTEKPATESLGNGAIMEPMPQCNDDDENYPRRGLPAAGFAL